MMQFTTTPGVQGVCPSGCHLPTDEGFTTLSTYLGGESVAGGKMKSNGTVEAGTGLWNSGLKLHAAKYLYASAGSLNYRGSGGYYWSNKQYDVSNGRCLNFGYLIGMGFVNKTFGFSARCISDN